MKTVFLRYESPRLSLRARSLALIFALVAAVALPQICHVAGDALGVSNGIGELLLPMHLPVLLVGLLAGPAVGAVVGFFAPVLSFLLSGMPVAAALPFMCIELTTYGLCAGLLGRARLPLPLRVLIAQVAGRVVRMLAILMASGAGKTALSAGSVWSALSKGWVGILLQLVLIPAFLMMVERLSTHAEK